MPREKACREDVDGQVAAEALSSGLVDRLGYRDEAYARAREGAPGSQLRTVAA